jgi:hypothetical protein
MYTGVAGGGHGGGGHGGHHGGGHHHGGGGGRRGGGRGRWSGDASYPYAYPVVVDTCEVMDENGRCAIFDAAGRIIGFQGIGADDVAASSTGTTNATTWMAGGVLVLLAVGVLAIEKKGPAPFRRA